MGEGELATKVESRLGARALQRVLEIAHEPSRFGEEDGVVPAREVEGRQSYLVRLDDDGGWRVLHLRVWRGGRGGLAGMADRFRASAGLAMWAKAMALVDAGIATPRPLAAAERRPKGLEWSCFASEQLDAAIGLEEVLQQVAGWGEARQTKFARSLAGEFRKLRTRKLGMSELSPSSFLVRGVPDFEFDLFVCEPEATTIGGELSAAQMESRVLFGLPDKVVKAFFAGLG